MLRARQLWAGVTRRLRSRNGSTSLLAAGLVLATLGLGAAWLAGRPASTPLPADFATNSAVASLAPAAPAVGEAEMVVLAHPSSPVEDPAAADVPPARTEDVAGVPPAPERTEPVRAYRVAAGDNLADIAGRYGLRIETLVWANSLADPGLLLPGQELRIPVTDGVVYTLRPGDTLGALAERAGVPLADVVAANRFDNPDLVVAGAEVLVPGATPRGLLPPAARSDPSAPGFASLLATSRSASAVTYEVQPGDTLADLGTKFGINLETLLAANEIVDPDTITVGTRLRILPVSGQEHVVVPGERLADIAARYQTLLGLIVDFNAIADPDLVRPGDRLVIPGGRRLTQASSSGGGRGAATSAAPAPAQAAPRVSAPAPVAPAIAAPRPPEPAALPVAPSALGPRIAALALQYNGAPYVWGGTSPSGFDCSGFVWYALKQAGVSISRGLWGQYNAGPHVARSALQPGDLVFFQNTYMPGLSHNGIYLGNGQFIHAVDERQGVRISNINEPYWASRWFGATRVSG